MTLGKRTREIRKYYGLTQGEFASKLHVTTGYISNIETDKTYPSDMFINSVCLIWNIDDHWFRTGEGTMESRSNRLRQAAIEQPDLQRYIDNIESGASQRDQLARLFAPTYPKPFVLLTMLSQSSASDFLARLNLLVKEWGDSENNPRKRARIEIRIEDAIEDFQTKLQEYNRKKEFSGENIVPFSSLAATEATAPPVRVTLPVIGRAAAGAPKSMISLEGEELRTNGDEAHNIRPGDFIVVADGDSMIDCGIHDGDYCVIHQTPEVDNGQIALVAVDDGSTIKRFYKEDSGFRLVPCSADHAEQNYPPDAPIRVLGKFVKVIQPED